MLHKILVALLIVWCAVGLLVLANQGGALQRASSRGGADGADALFGFVVAFFLWAMPTVILGIYAFVVQTRPRHR